MTLDTLAEMTAAERAAISELCANDYMYHGDLAQILDITPEEEDELSRVIVGMHPHKSHLCDGLKELALPYVPA